MEYLYHGSSKIGLKEIYPFNFNYNAMKDKVACFTPFINMALLYILEKHHFIGYLLSLIMIIR